MNQELECPEEIIRTERVDTIIENTVIHETCPCCGHRTLPEFGEYVTCPNCYWEDDGIRNPEYYSSPNHMTLQEGINNFLEYGACSREFVQYASASGINYLR
ncbi:Cysteine-rich CPCC [Chitinophaga dinghuensis]|uniref:Cysteine-rich CPCC n=1 Tax=Chitinophaga dinghuensis TaxID=1539050 RepID=A0A327VXR4_9BACT|nr:CPCC family cysteine-rich protein [Chitinophaga dinghuensis]RAJ80292.1 Cysteine-rich CPCC [Chitinophaga dinghuensis]